MSSSSRQRSIIRHPHDYTGATVEARTEGTGPNRQSITVEYAYATTNYGSSGATTPNPNRAQQRASYAASRSTPPRAGSPTADRPPRVRNSLYKNPPAGSRKPSKEPSGHEQQPASQPVYEEPEEDLGAAQAYAAPQRPSRANTETLQDLYTPDVAAFSESTNTSTVYDRRASLPALPQPEDDGGGGGGAFVADMNEALPPTADPFGPGGHRSRSGTTSQAKPKKGGMLSFMSGA